MDFVIIPDTGKNMHVVLVIVDIASDITAADQGSTFVGEFEALCNDLGLVISSAAPEAHWQMVKVEKE
eukprot:1055481-Pyramimonas_sp.AAC.1